MRLLLVALVLQIFTTGAIAQSQNATFIAQEIAKISPCGFKCLSDSIPKVGCTLTNTTCQCRSSELISLASTCMTSKCTLLETLELAKIQADICERPNESRNRDIKAMTIAGITIIYGAVLLRLIARYFLNQGMSLDDWFIVIAAAAAVPYSYFGVLIESHGFGAHIWNFDIVLVGKLGYWFFVAEICYLLVITAVKISIICFYLHLFPKRSIRIQCWIMIWFCLTSCIAFLIVTVFQCRPIPYTWDKTIRGKCINFNAVTWSAGGVNIVQDVLIVLLPISEVRKLQMNRKKKFGLYIIFGLGIFVCVMSIIRMYSLKDFGVTADPTWDNQPTEFWSILESAAAFVCACLPAIRAGFVRVFPKSWRTINISSGVKSQKKAEDVGTPLSSKNQPWASRALTSNASTLVAADDIAADPSALPMGGIKVERSVRVVVSQLNLMKPLPRPRSHSFQMLETIDSISE